jgi:hypothetical protein
LEVGFDELIRQVNGHRFWLSYLSGAAHPSSAVGLHVAVFSEPFLSLVLSGQKTIESRFSRNRCAPYGEVYEGDIILMKEVAGPIKGIALARRSWCYDLASEPLERIRDRFAAGVCADDAFWAARADALYATLIELESAASLIAVRCDKRDRRGWVLLRSRQLAFNFS